MNKALSIMRQSVTHLIAAAGPVTPLSVDLKPDVVAVEDQGQLGSCTANAGVSALELAYERGTGVKNNFSRLFLYWAERDMLEQVKGDVGAAPEDIGKALMLYGVPSEATWPYDPDQLDATPSEAAFHEAEDYKIKAYVEVNLIPGVGFMDDAQTLQAIKASVAGGVPVLLAMNCYNGMMSLTGPWQQHLWSIHPADVCGGHEVLVIGYDDACERLLVENSWGPDWGDGGFFGLPYGYLPSALQEVWAITDPGVPIVPWSELGDVPTASVGAVPDVAMADEKLPDLRREAAAKQEELADALEELPKRIAATPDNLPNAEYVIGGMKEYFGDLITEEVETKVRGFFPAKE